MTRKEVAFARRRSRWTVWRWEKLGLPVVGGLVRMSQVDEFLASRPGNSSFSIQNSKLT